MATKLGKRVDVKGLGGLSLGLGLHPQNSGGDGEKIAKVTEMRHMRGRWVLGATRGKC